MSLSDLRNILKTAKQAATNPALKWDTKLLGKDELPKELTENKRLLLIFLLPRVFADLGFVHAATFNSLWQYGESDTAKLLQHHQIPGSSYYYNFNVSSFSKSVTIQSSINSALKSNIQALEKISSSDYFTERRWSKLRTFVDAAQEKYKKKDEWRFLTPSYHDKIVNPSVLLEIIPLDTLDYMANNENPLTSDAFAAMGELSIRVYMQCEIVRKKNEPKTYILPKSLAARIWDEYHFRDDETKLSVLVRDKVGARISQLLGVWTDASDTSSVLLQNADFQEYKNVFMKPYNDFLDKTRSTKRRLLCNDFALISNYVAADLPANLEYRIGG